MDLKKEWCKQDEHSQALQYFSCTLGACLARNHLSPWGGTKDQWQWGRQRGNGEALKSTPNLHTAIMNDLSPIFHSDKPTNLFRAWNQQRTQHLHWAVPIEMCWMGEECVLRGGVNEGYYLFGCWGQAAFCLGSARSYSSCLWVPWLWGRLPFCLYDATEQSAGRSRVVTSASEAEVEIAPEGQVRRKRRNEEWS